MSSSGSVNVQSFCFQKENTFFKIPKEVNFLVENEVSVATCLKPQNFVKCFGTCEMECWLNVEDEKEDKDGAEKILCAERMPGKSTKKLVSKWELLDGVSLLDFINDLENTNEIVINLCMQVFCAILEQQSINKFVHGDLHCRNVIVVKSDPVARFDYSISNCRYYIPNLGFQAKIIDFGNSCIWDRENNFCTTPLFGFDAGEVNIFFDPYYDVKYFVDAIKFELFRSRKCSHSSNLNLLEYNLFRERDKFIDKFKSVDKELLYEDLVNLFSEHGSHAEPIESFVDLFLGAVKLPFKKATHEDLSAKVACFMQYWLKIEKYFTPLQTPIVLKKCINFCSNSSSFERIIDREGAFFALIHENLKEFKADQIYFTNQDTSLVYNSMCLVIQELSKYCYINTETFEQCIGLVNNQVEDMLRKVRPHQHPSVTLTDLLFRWSSLN